MPPLSRRKALTLASGLALTALPGCSGLLDESRPTETRTQESLVVGDWFATEDGREVRVWAAKVRRSVVTTESVSHHVYEVVSTPPEGQYLVVTVTSKGFDVEPMGLPLTVAIDGEPRRERSVVRVGSEDLQTRDRLAFHLPRVDAAEAAVVWEREGGSPVRWLLGDRVRDRLAAVPEFSVVSVSIPDRVERGETVPASFTVRNDGDRDGRFLTTFGVKQGSLGVPEVSAQVPAGETVTESERLRPPTYDHVDSLSVVMDWGRGHRNATVDVVDRATPTTTGGDDGA